MRAFDHTLCLFDSHECEGNEIWKECTNLTLGFEGNYV